MMPRPEPPNEIRLGNWTPAGELLHQSVEKLLPVVEGLDQSPELIDVAKRSAIHQPSSVSFHVGNLLALPDHRYDAILCRGVLNDLVDTGSREAVFSSFTGALRPGGLLILDVREWEATQDRKQREPLFRKSVETDRG